MTTKHYNALLDEIETLKSERRMLALYVLKLESIETEYTELQPYPFRVESDPMLHIKLRYSSN